MANCLANDERQSALALPTRRGRSIREGAILIDGYALQ
jgi:hypothetical protein